MELLAARPTSSSSTTTWSSSAAVTAAGGAVLARQDSAVLARQRSADERAARQRALVQVVEADRETAALDDELAAVANAVARELACSRPSGPAATPLTAPSAAAADDACFRKFEKFGNASMAEVMKLRWHIAGGGKAPAQQQQQQQAADAAAEWVATEKVDGEYDTFSICAGETLLTKVSPSGANFSIVYDGTPAGWRCASRNRLLPLGAAALAPGQDFHGHVSVLERHKPHVAAVWRQVCAVYPAAVAGRVHVYGELCGGVYNHPAVPAQPTGTAADGQPVYPKPVLTRVQYSPRMEFFPFDVFVVLPPPATAEPGGGGGGGRPPQPDEPHGFYLGFAELLRVLHAAGFEVYASPVARGTLPELLQLDVGSMPSTLPAQLGLPPLSEAGRPNLLEGVVLRPAGGGLGGDAAAEGLHHHPRAMLKLKGAAFYERAPGHAKEAAAAAETICGGRLPQGLAAAWLEHICPSRLASVRSKHSEAEFADRPAMVAELVADAEADFVREAEAQVVAAWLGLPAPTRQLLRGQATREAFSLFKQLL